MFYLKIISLESCPYSEAVEQMLKNYSVQHKIKKVNTVTKQNYKNSEIDTFPQIYLVNNKKSVLLGGYTEMSNVYDTINSTNNLNDILNKLNNKLSTKWSRKEKLRLIQILNKKLN